MQRIILTIAIFVIAPFIGFADSVGDLAETPIAAPPIVQIRDDEPTATDALVDVVMPKLTVGPGACEVSPCEVDSREGDSCSSRTRHNRALDRIWLISTRSLSSDACCASLTVPGFQVWRVDQCGNASRSNLDEFLAERITGRPLLFQIHGNRMSANVALDRGMFVYHQTIPYCDARNFDFVIFSWPSERDGILVSDGREKAQRTDAEGLYLAWLVRELVQRDVPLAMIGFSFGGRVATGSLHALAGGRLGGRQLPGEHLTSADVTVGLIAPALEDDWLRPGSYHGRATQNIQHLSVLYNRRDAVLKRYWLLDKVRDNIALGFTGPRGVGPRADGSPMPVFSLDCSPTLGIRHDEKKYYLQDCRAGQQVAKLIDKTY